MLELGVRIFLNMAAGALMGVMLAEPLMASGGGVIEASNASLVALGLAGVMLGRKGAVRRAA